MLSKLTFYKYVGGTSTVTDEMFRQHNHLVINSSFVLLTGFIPTHLILSVQLSSLMLGIVQLYIFMKPFLPFPW